MNKQLSHIDFRMIGTVLILVAVGLLCLFSTAHAKQGFSSGSILNRQLAWFVFGCMVATALALIPIHLLFQSAYLFYGLSLVLLISVLFIGSGPAQRWIQIGPTTFQPSEFAKVAVILALARYLSHEKQKYLNRCQATILFGIIFPPFFLILKEPDMGTASVFLALFIACMIWGGIRRRTVGFVGLALLALVTGFHRIVFICFIAACLLVLIMTKQRLWKFLGIIGMCLLLGLLSPWLWSKMALYQQHRIFTFLGLHTDPAGAAYQAIQSRIAIGSGGFWGKGFMQGTQTQLRFLPEQHTDFIFSVLGEELGFLGVSIVLTCFGLLFSNFLSILKRTRNRFASFVLVGSLSILFYQVVVNIGMTLGLVPVTGLPLPFLSYGGSSMVMAMAFIGLALNISGHRYLH